MRINSGALFPLIVVAMIAALGIGLVLSGEVGPSPVSLRNSCRAAFPSAPNNLIHVLVLQPGMSGEICVTYSNFLGNSFSNEKIYASVWVPETPPGQFRTLSPSSISIIPIPGTITFDQGARNESQIVIFKVSVASNITHGVFGLFLYQFCGLFPFAVGDPQTLTANEFSYWYPHTGSCPAQVMGAQVTGVTGFQIVNIRM